MEKENKRLVIFSPSSVLMKLYMGDNSSFYSPKFRPVKRGRAWNGEIKTRWKEKKKFPVRRPAR